MIKTENVCGKCILWPDVFSIWEMSVWILFPYSDQCGPLPDSNRRAAWTPEVAALLRLHDSLQREVPKDVVFTYCLEISIWEVWKHAVLIYPALSLSAGIITICRMWKLFKNESPGTKNHFCTEPPPPSLGINKKSLLLVSSKKPGRVCVPPGGIWLFIFQGRGVNFLEPYWHTYFPRMLNYVAWTNAELFLSSYEYWLNYTPLHLFPISYPVFLW